LAPFFRASDSPIAIACFRLFSVRPLLPDLSVRFFLLRIALPTRFDAALPYFRRLEGFRAAILLLRLDVMVTVSGPDWRVLCLKNPRVDRAVVAHLKSP
jgi:hypothetical protein